MPRKTLRKHGKGTRGVGEGKVHRKTQKGGFNPKKSGKGKGKGKKSLREMSPH